MFPTKSHRFLSLLLMGCAIFFIVREPEKAAEAAVKTMHGVGVLADAFVTFVSRLG
ncbi:hypothetical protein ACIBK1_06770 [Microbispora rosea]|uniref:hypothetical protein n=1 Tax=Microbispora rosea TaxID=58117 RepID=UPI00379A196C